jgi:hypothetical protein
VAFAGVAADLYYTGEDAVTARSPAHATVWLSPFEVRWQQPATQARRRPMP